MKTKIDNDGCSMRRCARAGANRPLRSNRRRSGEAASGLQWRPHRALLAALPWRVISKATSTTIVPLEFPRSPRRGFPYAASVLLQAFPTSIADPSYPAVAGATGAVIVILRSGFAWNACFFASWVASKQSTVLSRSPHEYRGNRTVPRPRRLGTPR